MAQINNDLETLKTARDNMKTALEEKGQTVTKDIRTYAEAISNISGSENLDSVLNAQDEKLEALEQLLLTKASGGGGDTKPYVELEYIESTGTQYIDTGIFPTTINKVDTSAMFTSATDNRIFGARYSLSGDKFVIGVNYSVSSIENKIQYGYGSDSWRVLDYTYIPVNKYFNVIFEFVIDGSSGKITLDGTSYNVTSESGISQLNNTSIYLFAINTPYLESTQQFGIAKIYSCKMYGASGSLVRDFIPVKRKSDNEICMYDKVTKQFYTNLGTGTFVAGPEKYVPTEETTMNIFVQNTEPETKKGIWLQTNKTMEHIYCDGVNVDNETWYADGTYSNIPFRFIRGGDAFNIGTDIYIIAGYESGEQRKIYKFDTINNSYTRLTDISVGISGSIVVNINNIIYFIGGDNILTSIYKYDITSQTTTEILNNFPNQIVNGAGIAVGTDIYIFGNNISNSSTSIYMNRAYKFNTLNNTITRLKDIPYDFGSTPVVNIGNYIYLCGSITNSGAQQAIRKYMYRYNVNTDSYERLTDIPFEFEIGDAVAFGDYIYFGGTYAYGENAPQSKYMYKYNTLTDTYTKLTDIPYYFRSGSMVLVDTKLFILGGYSYPNKVQCMQLDVDTSSLTDNTVVVLQSPHYTASYYTELFSNFKMVPGAEIGFNNVWFYTENDGLITNIPTYYGNGTNWVKFKN